MIDPTESRAGSLVNEALLRLLGRVNYERLHFRRHIGRFPNLREPQTFNEKLSAMKLFADLPLAPLIADKFAVRDYVAQVVGERYLKEVLVSADRVEDLDFGALPDSFAAKTSHGSGMNVIVREKSAIDLDVVRSRLAKFLRTKFGRHTNEWWYAEVKPRILVERFLHDERFGVAPDYDFFVFHGTAQFVRVMDKVSNRARDFYDLDWNLQDFYYADIPRGSYVEPPKRLQEMREVAEALAGDLDFVRVDLYSPNDDCVLFGEMTLAPGAGWVRIAPPNAAEYLGSLW